VILFQRRVGSTILQDLKLCKKRVILDAGKISFENRVCVEWNRLPGWVVNGEIVSKFKRNFDYYLRK